MANVSIWKCKDCGKGTSDDPHTCSTCRGIMFLWMGVGAFFPSLFLLPLLFPDYALPIMLGVGLPGGLFLSRQLARFYPSTDTLPQFIHCHSTIDGYVYLAATQHRNIYKLGMTTNPEERLFWLRRNYGVTEFVYLWGVSDRKHFERIALQMTNACLVTGHEKSELRRLSQGQVHHFARTFASRIGGGR